MEMMYIIFLAALFFCRMLSGFDSRYQKGRSYKIKNHTLAGILTDSMSFYERKKRLKSDADKISLAGVIFYIFGLAVFLLSIFLRFIDLGTSGEPYIVDTDRFFIYADTLSEKLSVFLIAAYFLAVLIWLAAATISSLKKAGGKAVTISLFSALIILILAVVFFGSLELLEFSYIF